MLFKAVLLFHGMQAVSELASRWKAIHESLGRVTVIAKISLIFQCLFLPKELIWPDLSFMLVRFYLFLRCIINWLVNGGVFVVLELMQNIFAAHIVRILRILSLSTNSLVVACSKVLRLRSHFL